MVVNINFVVVVVVQAVRQKLHIKSRSLFSDMMTFPRGVTGSEEDKTKLLLGLSIPVRVLDNFFLYFINHN